MEGRGRQEGVVVFVNIDVGCNVCAKFAREIIKGLRREPKRGRMINDVISMRK